LVLTRDIRKQKLGELLANPNAAIANHKLWYKGSSNYYPVHKVDLSLLEYNRHNGRLETEMQSFLSEHDVDDTDYNREIHELIELLLWTDAENRNKATKADLALKGQQNPAIVTADGVIIDGNRRTMLLNKLNRETGQNYHLEAVILPDSYADDEKAIVTLETQYQMGEDAKVDYGPLEKYLHAKRLHKSIGLPVKTVAELMGVTEGKIEQYLAIMDLMDDYLDHVGCPGIYNMLKEESGGTKEGMFVDLALDLKRLDGRGRGTVIDWPITDSDFDELKIIHLDHIRMGGQLSDTNKRYREISHEGAGKRAFFAHETIWSQFREGYFERVEPKTRSLDSLDKFHADHPEFSSRQKAALAREGEWRATVRQDLMHNFGSASDLLEAQVSEAEPSRLLQKALNYLSQLNPADPSIYSDESNRNLVAEINTIAYEIRRNF